jgi:hypothetical protein
MQQNMLHLPCNWQLPARHATVLVTAGPHVNLQLTPAIAAAVFHV